MTEPNIPNFFDTASSSSADDLMSTQLASDQIEPANGVFTTTDPIIADRLVEDRVSYLDPELYDLRSTSHFMKLLKVLLGGPGAGGLRKQVSVARMQNMLSGMHFLDLDHFYGALFGLRRATTERFDVGFDPYRDGAAAATWDDTRGKDASYRDRIAKFALAINLGGTYNGLCAMVSALTGSPCEIYESWAWIDDTYNLTYTPVGTYTYTFLSSTITSWSQLENNPWSTWGGSANLFAGRTGQKARSELVVIVKRDLTAAERYELLRVLRVFIPAFTSFTVTSQAQGVEQSTSLRAASASSEYWEVVSRTTPNPSLVQPSGGIYPNTDTQARPAFSQYQGDSWSYNGEVSAVNSYSLAEDGSVVSNDDETVVYGDGATHVYVASDGVMTSSQAHSARLASDGVMTSTSYAVSRGSSVTAVTSGT